ncbi:MAG: hypothetical protein WC708_06715, partial [Lentisphaeria bacterium]
MGNVVETPVVADVKDRKTGLVVFGIFEILLGAFFLLLLLVMTVGMAATAALGRQQGAASPLNAGAMLAVFLFYALLATWFIWMGIGSILARRWARALLLVSSWLWLVCGIMGLGYLLIFLPAMREQMSGGGQLPQQVVAIIQYVIIGIMTIFYLIIPGAFVLFYGSRHTKATCERRDPRIRWTDKCPLPVLAVSLMAGSWAACMPVMGVYGWAVPFFGTILTGGAGAAVALACLCLFGYVAWGTYRLRMGAWWCAALAVVAWSISGGLTLSRAGGLLALYEKMGFSGPQLTAMKPSMQLIEPWMMVFSVVWVAVALI